jgi:DNA-binding NtrC family response regulator
MPRRVTPPLVVLVRPGDRDAIERASARVGLDVAPATSLPELLALQGRGPWSGTLVSLSVDLVGERVVQRVGEQPGAGALIVSAPAFSLESAVALRASGATALLREPIDEDDLTSVLGALVGEGVPVALPEPPPDRRSDAPPLLLGASPAMAAVSDMIARVAGSSATVLVTGESGTGKEVVARALHWASPKARGPFVAVNCAAIPEHLLETELFGHERGAFTGAVARRVGRFERAHGGTLFLDEIGDMSLVLQAKVLRVIEDRVVERVGGEEGRSVDVRVIAATNQDLSVATLERRFREDLYHRLAVVGMHLPPLRERGEDVRVLALHFAAHFAARYAKPIRAITERALEQLGGATWPGNVRELRNVMDRAVILATGSTIRRDDLQLGAAAPLASAHATPDAVEGYLTSRSLREVEQDHIRRVLSAVDGHMGRAAETLGIHRNTLTRKMKELGLQAAGPTTSSA